MVPNEEKKHAQNTGRVGYIVGGEATQLIIDEYNAFKDVIWADKKANIIAKRKAKKPDETPCTVSVDAATDKAMKELFVCMEPTCLEYAEKEEKNKHRWSEKKRHCTGKSHENLFEAHQVVVVCPYQQIGK